MASVKLKFRVSSLPEKEGTLYFQVIHERVVKQIGTSYRIYEFEWDEHRSDIVKQSLIAPNRVKTIKSIREKIAWEKNRLNKIIEQFKNKGRCFSVDEIIREYYAQSSNKTAVFEYIKIQIERLKNSGKDRTSETYRQMLLSLMKFRNGEDLFFDMIDDTLICQYENHMRIFGLCRNTTSFYLRVFRSVYNRAVDDGLTEQTNPFKRVYTGVDKTSKRAISLKEIKKIKDLDLSSTPTLDFARDMFLFSFYMRGMSFIDIAYLKKKNLSNGFVVYNRRKTGQQLVVKWEKQMEAIANKHLNSNNPFLFPIITKEDGTERKQYLNKMMLINRYLKKIAELAKIPIPLTMYVAHHSWASIAQSKNVPMQAISLGMGQYFSFDLEDLEWEFNKFVVSDVISRAFEPLLKKIATIMYAYNCDIVLLSGRPSSLSPIRNIFLKYYSVSPNRLILLNDYFVGHWYPNKNNTGKATAKTIVAMGALVGYYATSLGNLDKFLIDKSQLDKKLKSVINYIESSREGQPIEYFITPDKNMGELMVSSLPTTLNVRQIGLDSYPSRKLYVIDFNQHKMLERIRSKAIQEGTSINETQALAKVKEIIDDLRLRMPFQLSIERDEDDKEKLIITAIVDKKGNELADSNIEINIQSLGADERYWLDTGAFDIQ